MSLFVAQKSRLYSQLAPTCFFRTACNDLPLRCYQGNLGTLPRASSDDVTRNSRLKWEESSCSKSLPFQHLFLSLCAADPSASLFFFCASHLLPPGSTKPWSPKATELANVHTWTQCPHMARPPEPVVKDGSVEGDTTNNIGKR